MSTFKALHHNEFDKPEGKDSDDNVFKEERLGEYRVVSLNSGEAIFQFCEVMNAKVTSGEVVAYGDSDASSYLVEAAASTSNTIRAAGAVYTTASVGDGVWVQKKGPNLKPVNTSNSVSADSALSKSSQAAGVLTNGVAAGAEHGIAFAGDGSNSQLAQGEAYLDFPM